MGQNHMRWAKNVWHDIHYIKISIAQIIQGWCFEEIDKQIHEILEKIMSLLSIYRNILYRWNEEIFPNKVSLVWSFQQNSQIVVPAKYLLSTNCDNLFLWKKPRVLDSQETYESKDMCLPCKTIAIFLKFKKEKRETF